VPGQFVQKPKGERSAGSETARAPCRRKKDSGQATSARKGKNDLAAERIRAKLAGIERRKETRGECSRKTDPAHQRWPREGRKRGARRDKRRTAKLPAMEKREGKKVMEKQRVHKRPSWRKKKTDERGKVALMSSSVRPVGTKRRWWDKKKKQNWSLKRSPPLLLEGKRVNSRFQKRVRLLGGRGVRYLFLREYLGMGRRTRRLQHLVAGKKVSGGRITTVERGNESRRLHEPPKKGKRLRSRQKSSSPRPPSEEEVRRPDFPETRKKKRR